MHRGFETLLGVIAATTVAVAQSLPSPAALASQSSLARTVSTGPVARSQQADEAEAVYVMKTAGQKDRRIQVLKVSSFPDGDSIAEVKDVTTGQTFTVPGTMLKRMAKVELGDETAKPKESNAPEAPANPRWQQDTPAIAKASVEVRSQPEPLATQQSVATAESTEGKVVRRTYLPLDQEPIPVGTAPQAATTLPGTLVRVESSVPVVVAPVVRPETWKPTGVNINASAEDRWSKSKVPYQAPAKVDVQPQPVIRGQIDDPKPQPQPKPSGPRTTPQISEERHDVELAAYLGSRSRVRTFSEQLAMETKDFVYDLATALRPSQREYAATGLANCRFASRPEVKMVLAKAAMADPSSSVRAHCIQLLAKLGFHEPEYTDYLKSCEASEFPMVRVAANYALATLQPKR